LSTPAKITSEHIGEFSEHGADLPLYISAGNIKSLISNELETALVNKIKYRTAKGGAIGFGLEASLLPQVYDVWLNRSFSPHKITITTRQ
jgi:hypothetical protein